MQLPDLRKIHWSRLQHLWAKVRLFSVYSFWTALKLSRYCFAVLRRLLAPVVRLAKPLLAKLIARFPALKDTNLRFSVGLLAVLLAISEILGILQPYMVPHTYALGSAGSLLTPVNQMMANKLTLDAKQQLYTFNQGYTPPSSGILGMGGPQITATAGENPGKGVSVTDPTSKTSLTIAPDFNLLQGHQDGNRIVYPIMGGSGSGWVVYTMHAIGVKEDVLLTGTSGNIATLDYTLGLGNSLSARVEKDGSIGIYGNSLLSGNIATSTSKDAALLQKARKNAPKNTLLFTIPPPTVKALDKKPTGVKAAYSLQGDNLRVTITGLMQAHYPIDIDPSIYVTSAQQFMNGNNDTNIDFDVADSLIEKGKTTGARFDSWNPTMSLNTAVWRQGIAAAGGFIYTVGGVNANGGSQTYTTPGNDTFNVPSGVSSIVVKAWGAGGGGGGGGRNYGSNGGNGGGGGYAQTTLSVTAGETLNVAVGGGGGAGSGSSNAGGGGGGGGYSEVARGSTPLIVAAGGAGGGGGGYNTYSAGDGGAGGGSSGIAGSTGANGNGGGGGGTQSSGGSGGTGGNNSGSAGSYLQGGAGADGRSGNGSDGSENNGGIAGGGDGGSRVTSRYAGGGGGGGGYYGGGGGSGSGNSDAGGGGGGGSGYTSGTNNTNTAGSGETPGNSGDSSRNNAGQGGDGGSRRNDGNTGTSGIVIITYSTDPTVLNTVSWAQFNPDTGLIQDANPGSGPCTGWCTNSLYNLPEARSNLSLVAYNGFLYAIGGNGSDCTSANGTGDGGVCNTVYIAKLGANGEPQLWSPVSTDRSTWQFWYKDSGLTTPRAFTSAVAYNDQIYLLGGETSSGGTASITNTVQVANIIPTGKLGSWTTSSSSLPYNLYQQGAQIYNGNIYIIGGASSIGGAPLSSVYYNKINANGSLNNWVQTSSLLSGRATSGGNFTVMWGGYIYISGGCSSVNASGYCTSIASDTEMASINADGSLDTWLTNTSVSDGRVGYNLVAWNNYIYEIGGCSAGTATGTCSTSLDSINYGAINQDGDISSATQSVANGTAPCSGSNPYDCNLPPAGSGSGQIGQMQSAIAIVNGYVYAIGGCVDNGFFGDCDTTSTNSAYAAISSDGNITAPANCAADGNTLVGSWCVDNTHVLNTGGGFFGGGVAGAATAVFDNTIYFIGGITGTNMTGNIYYVSTNTDGSLNTNGWTSESMSTAGATSVAYEYAYTRSNPVAVDTTPGNLYIFGGCTNVNFGSTCNGYTGAVYKCNIGTDASVSGCTTSGQLQFGTAAGASSSGLDGMGGTVYANYVYLIGGSAPGAAELGTVYYAKIDDNNNIVAASGSDWTLSSNQISDPTEYASAFGYNGYLYSVGGYDGSNVLGTVQFAEINVSDGSIGTFNTSSANITPSWGMGLAVSNANVYIIGGCSAGAPPFNCSSQPGTVQNFVIYNNDSGAPAGYSTASNTYTTDPNRLGVAATVLNGYLYVAGGCTSATGCTTVSSNVSYAQINADGSLGTWTTTTGLPAGRAWGKLETVGGSLYYLGGQDSGSTKQSQIYYATPSANGAIPSWTLSSHGLPLAMSDFSATTWNNRMYVTSNYQTGTSGVNDSWSTGDINTRTTYTTAVFDRTDSGKSNYVVAPIQSGVDAYTPGGDLDWSFNGIVQGYDVRDIAVGNLQGTGYNDTIVVCSGYYPGSSYPNSDYLAILNKSGTPIQLIHTPSNDSQCTNVLIDGTNIFVGSTYGIAEYTKSGSTWTMAWQTGIGTVGDMKIADAGNGTRLFVTSTTGHTLYEYQLNGTQDWSATLPSNNYNGNIAIGKTDPSISGDQIVVDSQNTAVIFDKNGNQVGALNTGTNVRDSVTLYDVNGTGVDDIYLSDMGGNIYAWQNTGPNTYAVQYHASGFMPNGTYAGLSNANLFGSGSNNIIAAGTNGVIYMFTPDLSTVAYTINIGNGSIGYRYDGNYAIKSNIVFSDINGDGNPDMVVPSNNGYVDIITAQAGLNSNLFVSPQLNSGGDVTGTWSTSSASIAIPRTGATLIAYANNLYLLGGIDNSGNYMSDVQYAQINSNNGNVGSWSFTTSLPYPISGADGFAVNGYMYLIGGRSSTNTCTPSTLVAPISANTTIVSGNHPTGVGQWFETNQEYSAQRYGNAAVYSQGKAYVIGGACGGSQTFASPAIEQTALLSQPQVARYSIMFDTDSDVYPQKWLLNGLDNSIGAEWQLAYQSMTNTTTFCTSPAMTTWGKTTNVGNVVLGTPGVYTPLDGSGNDTNCARFFYLAISIDSSQAYGYPEDVSRGPTIDDLTLEFTADPAKRLMHGRTFTGGIQQPDATPF